MAGFARSHRLLSKRGRRGMTLVELMTAFAIMMTITAPLFATMIQVFRTQATAANQSLVRLQSNKVMSQMAQDVRNASVARYNDKILVSPKLVNNSTQLTFQVMDTVIGRRVTWTYTKATKKFTRSEEVYDGSGSAKTSSKTYQIRYEDVSVSELAFVDKQTNLNEEGQVTGEVATSTITGFLVTARTFLTISSYNSIIPFVDQDNNNNYGDDKVGADLFGREDKGDKPGWQLILNTRMIMRNT